MKKNILYLISLLFMFIFIGCSTPPEIESAIDFEWTYPESQSIVVVAEKATITGTIFSNYQLLDVKLLLNGKEEKSWQPYNFTFQIIHPLKLVFGENIISIIATDDQNYSSQQTFRIINRFK